MKLADSDQLCAGKVWRRCFDIQNAIDTAAALEEWGDWSDELEEIKELWAYRWIKLHSPVYAVAYALNPEYHKSKPWEDVEVAADMDTVLVRFFGTCFGTWGNASCSFPLLLWRGLLR